MIPPDEARPLLLALGLAFAAPTFQRFTALTAAALLAAGRRTVADLLRTLGGLAPGRRASRQRLLPTAQWPGPQPARLLTRFLLQRLSPQGAVRLAGGGAADGRKGKKAHGEARRRGPVRPARSYTAGRYGHKRVALAVLASFPFAARPRALPVLVGLYYREEDDRRRGRPRRAPARRLRRLLRLMPLRFPQRKFLVIGDSAYGAHEVARFACRRRGRLTPVGKPRPQADSFEPPPPHPGEGRPRVKGRPLPKPSRAARAARRRRPTAGRYGGGRRRVGVVTGRGRWYKSGRGPAPLRRVFVHDKSGGRRDGYFFSTDPAPDPRAVAGHYTARRGVETTFRELRARPGPEAARGRRRNTARRAAPRPFGLYSVVALLHASLPASRRELPVRRPGKEAVTPSDALTAARRRPWLEGVFPQADGGCAAEKLPGPTRAIILSALAPAA